MPRLLTPGEPKISHLPSETVAEVTSVGDPNVVGETVFPALYGAVYTLKFQLKKDGKEDFKVTGLRGRYPDAHLVPKDKWTIIWALPVPEGTTDLPKKVPEPDVKLKVWDYGTVAEILHIGAYTEEGPNIEKLHKFIEESGYEIAGPHEEEYLTRPTSKVVKTIIRYQVKKR